MAKNVISLGELSIYNNSCIKNAVHLSIALWRDASKIPDICTFISTQKHEDKKIPQEVAHILVPREFQNMVIVSKKAHNLLKNFK